jgi:DNA-binding transcriptional ArsR family regulator
MPVSEYLLRVARAPTTLDAFNAIAEPRRRELMGVLADGGADRDVSWLVDRLGWPQPQVSKHLAVLREVGLVDVEQRGRQRIYTLNADKLRPIHEWVSGYKRFWEHQLHRIKDRAERLQRERDGRGAASR